MKNKKLQGYYIALHYIVQEFLFFSLLSVFLGFISVILVKHLVDLTWKVYSEYISTDYTYLLFQKI